MKVVAVLLILAGLIAGGVSALHFYNATIPGDLMDQAAAQLQGARTDSDREIASGMLRGSTSSYLELKGEAQAWLGLSVGALILGGILLAAAPKKKAVAYSVPQPAYPQQPNYPVPQPAYPQQPDYPVPQQTYAQQPGYPAPSQTYPQQPAPLHQLAPAVQQGHAQAAPNPAVSPAGGWPGGYPPGGHGRS